MKFEYKLTGIGLAKGVLELNNQKLEFEVSYLSDPLFELLGTLINMLPTYYYELDIKENEFEWLGEPWGYKWIFKFKKNNMIHLKITYYPELFGAKKLVKGKVVINTECDLDEFIKVVVKACEVILAEYGILGYDKTWHGTYQYFPITEFLILKDYIGEKKYYKMCTKENISISDYEYELNLLKSKTK